MAASAIYLLRSDDGAEPSTPAAWDAQAQRAFAPLVDRTPGLVSGARAWLAGEKTDEEFRVEVGMSRVAFEKSRDNVVGLEAPPAFATGQMLYLYAAQLYVETAVTYGQALEMFDRAFRLQADLVARRLRLLGDRIFDRGRVALGLDRQPAPDVEINVPEDVPDWVAEGLAAGPPLEPTPSPPPPDLPPLREDERPEQSRAAWLADVRAADIPSFEGLRSAIDSGEPDMLAALARRFVAAAERLRSRPDPSDGRERSARFRLGLLVAADAARAVQVSHGGLQLSAHRLVDIAKGMMSL